MSPFYQGCIVTLVAVVVLVLAFVLFHNKVIAFVEKEVAHVKTWIEATFNTLYVKVESFVANALSKAKQEAEGDAERLLESFDAKVEKFENRIAALEEKIKSLTAAPNAPSAENSNPPTV